MSDSVVSAATALKEYYAEDVCQSLIFKDCPFYAMVKKDKAFGGKTYLRIPFIWGTNNAIGTTFATVQANALNSSLSINEVQVTRVVTYAIGYLDTELLLASEGKGSAFVEMAKPHVDGLITNLSRDIEIASFRDGYGYRAQISSTSGNVTGTTITLARASDAFNFEVGFRLDLSAVFGASAAKKAYGSSANPLIVTGINTDLGTLTFGYSVNDATNGCPTIAQGDYIYLQGDVATTRNKPCGCQGWIPDAAPTGGENFYGLDRSVHQRLYGQRLDITSTPMSYTEALNKAIGKVHSYGGKVTHGFCSFNTYQDIINSLEAKVRYIDRETEGADVGFRGVELITPKGTVEIYPSIAWDDSHIHLLQLDQWGIYSLKDEVHRISEDGIEMLRAANADKLEIRYRSSMAIGCRAPAYNAVIKIAA